MTDDLDGMERPRLLMSLRLLEATTGITTAAVGTLVMLIGMAAKSGHSEIPVSAPNVAPELRHAEDREAFPARFAELKLRGLVKEVRAGIYLIAPGLWKVSAWDPEEEEFFPFG